MDTKRKPGADVLKKILPPLTAWAVRRMLTNPRKAGQYARIARKVRRVRNKAVANRVWIVAGAAAFVVGIGFLAFAAKRK
jgi:hypothetical protein